MTLVACIPSEIMYRIIYEPPHSAVLLLTLMVLAAIDTGFEARVGLVPLRPGYTLQ